MITVNLDKARAISHGKRRVARAAEFQPYDDIIARQIPGNDPADAETRRQAIREKYADVQGQIDVALTPAELKSILVRF